MTVSTGSIEAASIDAPVSLLSAKLSVPKPRELVVPRYRLFDQLTEGVTRPLTIVSGPSGSGKTTLVASLIAHELAPGRVAWLTLDENDDHPGIFWRHVVESLRCHGVDLPSDVGSPLHPGPVEPSLLERLAAALADRHEPAILVLDQFEAVTSSELLRDLDSVLMDAAPELRLVLITRSEPGALARRHLLRGELTSIRAADLAFRADEAESLLAQHGIHLAPTAFDQLAQHVEGWAAGLRLCVVAMQQHRDPVRFIESLPSGRAGLADYLVAEVLDAQPEPVRDFLLRTSVVEPLSPELVDALTDWSNGADQVATFARQNTLAEAVDEAAG